MKPTDTPTLTSLFLIVQRAIQTATNAHIKKRGVSVAQYECLGHLAASGPIVMSEIAAKMGHTTAAATGLVDRLVVLGLVQRETTPGDRRRITVTLTENGRVFMAGTRVVAEHLIADALRGADADHVAATESVFDRLAARLRVARLTE